MSFLSLFSASHLLQFGRAVATRKAPLYCQFVVTNRCLSRCAYCAAPARRSREPELNLDQIDLVARRVAELGVVFLVITGGEPFTRPDLTEVVRRFARTGMITRLQTTGIGADDGRIREVIDAGLTDFSISLNALTPELQGRLCGIEDSLARTFAALAAILRHRRPRSVLTGVNVVVNRANLHQIRHLVAFCSHVGLIVSLIPLHVGAGDGYVIRGADDGTAPLGFGPSDESELRATFTDLLAMKRLGHTIHDSSWLLGRAPDFLLGRAPAGPCDSPGLYFTVSASGRVLPCVDRDAGAEPVRVLDDGFVRDFRSGRVRQRLAASVAACSGCLYPCYPEFSRLVRSPAMMWERLRQVRQAQGQSRAFEAEELLELADRFARLAAADLIRPPSAIRIG